MVKNTPIVLPEEFMKYVDRIMKKKEFGFQSREEVVKAAVRDFFDKVIGKWYDYGLQQSDLVPRVKNNNKTMANGNKPKKKTSKVVVDLLKNQQRQKTSPSSGKLQVTAKMRAEFRSNLIKIIKSQKKFPQLLLDLKHKACELCSITRVTKPYTGKFSQYLQNIITENQLQVAIEPPNLVKK